MNILKKFLTLLFGLQLVGCASNSDNNFERYNVEKTFKYKYRKALDFKEEGIYSKALVLFNGLEKDKYPPAIYTLYVMYNNGEGVTHNRKKH